VVFFEMEALSVVVHKSVDDFAISVAKEIASVILNKKGPVVLGLATGSTPIPVYKHLVELLRNVKDLSHVHSFNLDEYEGLSAENDQSYRYFMQEHLFDHVKIPASQIHFPSGSGADYDAAIARAGGIDIQLLGIGVNGHIGFNEPGSARDSRTRRVELSEETRASNARWRESKEKTYVVGVEWRGAGFLEETSWRRRRTPSRWAWRPSATRGACCCARRAPARAR
jgi:glucosamine-6-phosphate deaminase